MGFFDSFWRPRKPTASTAKDRLSIIVARERRGTCASVDYLMALKQELLQVLAKYEQIDLDHVNVHVEKSGDCDVLELNVVLSGAQGDGLSAVFP